MDMLALGGAIKMRRHEVGLTQARLAKFAELSRQTVQKLEAGTISDLSFRRIARLLNVLGMQLGMATVAPPKKRGLWMAAKTSSIRYRGELTSAMLGKSLATGKAPPGYEAHIGHLLEEAPVELIVMAVEEVAEAKQTPPSEIWEHVAQLAEELADARKGMWT